MGLPKYYKQIFSYKVILSLSPFVAEYSPLKYHIYLLGIEIVELFLEIAASHESVAVRVENIEGCMRLFEENKISSSTARCKNLGGHICQTFSSVK